VLGVQAEQISLLALLVFSASCGAGVAG